MQEGLKLDFKTAAIGKLGALFTNEGKLTTSGKAAIAKALSAFSNRPEASLSSGWTAG
ncbi:hypothetical protein [Mesorhizobium escarrei]|uniref:hypothetical protein n=1 Tax=Mesorhizobium escarrei TaxID=666018 RepID=UPI0020A7CADC|nr:hypothetical protein [Mesorhizobium escarrei]